MNEQTERKLRRAEWMCNNALVDGFNATSQIERNMAQQT